MDGRHHDRHHLRISSREGQIELAPGRRITLGLHPDGSVIIGSASNPDVVIAEVHDAAGCWSVEATGSSRHLYAGGVAVKRLLVGSATTIRLGDPGGAVVDLMLVIPSSEPVTVAVRSGGSAVGAIAEPAPAAVVSASQVAAGSQQQPHPAASLVLRGLTVETKGHRRLDGVDLTLSPSSFLAVLGTSGAGKSTLLKAITGVEPATSGRVSLGGQDLYVSFAELRHQIGYVPQEDILHPQLTVADTLDFAARLRFPADFPAEARRTRIQSVIDELGLSARASARVDQLSGGQRKRVNVAVELLTEPSLLILDEPTSGLDPGNERLMMELLRGLADRGRMVIVVTHSIESLHLCDQVLFLARGGVPVYSGAPAGLPPHMGVRSFTEVFSALERMDDPSVSRVAPVEAPAAATTPPTAAPLVRTSLVDRARSADPAEIGRQFRILAERYVKVIASDRRNLSILALQAPVIAVLMLAVFGRGYLSGDTVPAPEAGNVLMAMVLATIYLGASNAVREIVKERPILRREQNFGLSIVAYIGSKFIVLGVLTVAQAGVLVLVGGARQGGPTDGVLPLPPKIELLLLVSVCGLSALCLGLMISAVSSSGDKAMTVLPVMLFVQFLLAGLIFPVTAPLVQQLSWLTTARWGFSGAASTADFWTLRGCGTPTALDCSVLWQHEMLNWLLSYTMLCVLGLGACYLTWRAIDRHDPVQVLARVADPQGASRGLSARLRSLTGGAG